MDARLQAEEGSLAVWLMLNRGAKQAVLNCNEGSVMMRRRLRDAANEAPLRCENVFVPSNLLIISKIE